MSPPMVVDRGAQMLGEEATATFSPMPDVPKETGS